MLDRAPGDARISTKSWNNYMPQRLLAILNKLERFMVRVVENRLDELLFVIVSILALMGIAILGDFIAGEFWMFTMVILAMVPLGICGLLMNRGLARAKRENPRWKQQCERAERRRQPRDHVTFGLILLTCYPVGLLLSMYAPPLHPMQGKMWFWYALALAAAPGFLLVGTVGFFDWRICLATTQHARRLRLPLWTRLVGRTLFWGGFAFGGCLAYLVYG